MVESVEKAFVTATAPSDPARGLAVKAAEEDELLELLKAEAISEVSVFDRAY